MLLLIKQWDFDYKSTVPLHSVLLLISIVQNTLTLLNTLTLIFYIRSLPNAKGTLWKQCSLVCPPMTSKVDEEFTRWKLNLIVELGKTDHDTAPAVLTNEFSVLLNIIPGNHTCLYKIIPQSPLMISLIIYCCPLHRNNSFPDHSTFMKHMKLIHGTPWSHPVPSPTL